MQEILDAIAGGTVQPVYLIVGDRVLAEPAAARLAEALTRKLGAAPETRTRPDSLADVVADLRTFSLFASGKVVIVVESGLLADRTEAAALFDDVRRELPFKGSGDELSGRNREAALRLLQILRLFDVRPVPGGAEKALADLPPFVFEGKSGRAAKAKGAADELKREAAPLLEAALAAGLQGIGESDASLVADLLRDGLPEGHVLVLVESAAAADHPLVKALGGRKAVHRAGSLSHDRGRFEGVGDLAAELARETGAKIDRDALDELARRTLRTEDFRRGEGVDPRSTARFAAEYRKLAALAGAAAGGTGNRARIELASVETSVEDRGEEDAFAILDAIGAGNGAAALAKMSRKLAGAEDPVLERLTLFSNVARFYRQIVAVRGIAARLGIPPGERNYKRFADGIFPKLIGPVDGVEPNPLKGSRSPFPLFKAYQTSARLPAKTIDRLPALLLETERRLKGDSGEPDAALAELVLAVAKPA